MVFDRIGRIKAPDPWKDHTSTMASGLRIHISPDDVEGVSYCGLGTNWMCSESLDR